MPRFTDNQLEFEGEQRLSAQTSFQRSRGKSCSPSGQAACLGVSQWKPQDRLIKPSGGRGRGPSRLPMEALKALYRSPLLVGIFRFLALLIPERGAGIWKQIMRWTLKEMDTPFPDLGTPPPLLLPLQFEAHSKSFQQEAVLPRPRPPWRRHIPFSQSSLGWPMQASACPWPCVLPPILAPGRL